jgi:hypothetical protein
VSFQAPAAGTELTTSDLSAAQLADFGIDPAGGDVPLSATSAGYFLEIPPGQTSVTFSLEIGIDIEPEGVEVTELMLRASYPLVVTPERVSATVASSAE